MAFEGVRMLETRLGVALGFAFVALVVCGQPARADCSTRTAYASGIVFVTDREPLHDDRIFGGDRARGADGDLVTTGTLAAPHLRAARGCASRLAYFQAIEHRFARGHGRRILVYVHGQDTSFVRAAEGALAIKRVTRFPGTVILYSWPATVTAKPAPTVEARNAAWSTAHFATFLRELEAHFPRTRVSFVGEGVGARFATTGIAIVRARGCARCFDRAVFVAPEIASETLRRRLEVAQLCKRGTHARGVAARVTVYATAARTRASCGDVDTVVVDARAFVARDGRTHVLDPRIARDAREALAGTSPTAPPRRLARGRARATYTIRG